MSAPDPARVSASAKAGLCMGALGVVFGDIGTSPLYTMQECVSHMPAGDFRAGVLGVLSLIFWSLVLVVSVKYLGCVMKADNHGEGGIFALLALLHGKEKAEQKASGKIGLGFTVVIILVGAALLYGDGVITPAISVLGAAEGFSAISPAFEPWVPSMACIILAALFWFQHKGTRSIGGVFGPIMLLWFVTLGALGGWQICRAPAVIRALDPRYAWFALHHASGQTTLLLGAVVLAITGAEALYADMGHFGRRYIGWAWYGAVLPGLVLNYFGQGSYLLAHPGAAANPFFAIAPAGLARASLTGLSIVAAVIASQALISGAYSLSRQAIQLGYFPRLKINYTNAAHSGQIYVPFVNRLLAIGCILTVILFGSTARLAAAYGIAVTGTMAITTGAFYFVTRRNWHWPLWQAAAVCVPFLAIDLAFFFSNARKISDGGWYPILIAAAILTVMHTWKTGRNAIFNRVYGGNVTEGELTAIARSKHIVRVKGAGVFMAGSAQGTPIALLHHVKSNRCLHETIVLLSIITEDIPNVPESGRLGLRTIGEGIWRAIGRYGYMQSPNVAALMEQIRAAGVPINPQSAVYFFNREMILTGGNSGMWEWEKSFYSFLSRNARSAKDYYQITPSQIIEIGLPVQL